MIGSSIFTTISETVNRIVSSRECAELCCVEFTCVLKHCETRWLSLRGAIDRTLEMWDPLLSSFISHEDVEKPGKDRIHANEQATLAMLSIKCTSCI